MIGSWAIPVSGRRSTVARRDALLALGMAVYPATQLRYDGGPIGVGELMMLAWLVLCVFARPIPTPGVSSTAVLRIGAFWAAMFLSLSIGALVGFWYEPFQFWREIVRDTFAYVLMLTLSLMMASELRERARRHRATRMFLAFGVCALLIQVAWWVGLPLRLGEDPWYYDRLRGWAKDPNQLGLFSAVVMLVGLQVFEWSDRHWSAAVSLASMGLAIFVGIATKSDTFTVCTGTLLIFPVMKARAWLHAIGLADLRRSIVILCLIFLPLGAASLLPFIGSAEKLIVIDSTKMYDKDDQGQLRFSLWAEAISKGLNVGMLGLGPGPHLTQKYWKYAPPYKAETHNTTFELFTQGGLLAAGSFVAICISTLICSWRARTAAACVLITGLIVFSMFHHIVRHPLFWFGLTIALLEATAENAAPSTRSLEFAVSRADRATAR